MSDTSDTAVKKPSRKKKVWVYVLMILLLIVVIYYFTYYLAQRNNKVIYQDSTRRIYLVSRKGYPARPDREMWNMVYEDMKTGVRTYITGNSKKGFSSKKMAEIVINTVDQGKLSSFDSVQRAGVTMAKAKTDIHTNLVQKKSIMDFFPEDKGFDLVFPI